MNQPTSETETRGAVACTDLVSRSDHLEKEDESLRALVSRLKLWCQYGPRDQVMRFLYGEVAALGNAEIAPESRMQRALKTLRSEMPTLPEVKQEPPPEPQDGYEYPYPFATRHEYQRALSRQRQDERQQWHEASQVHQSSFQSFGVSCGKGTLTVNDPAHRSASEASGEKEGGSQ